LPCPMEFVVNRRKSAEEEVAGIGHDGAAAGGDLVGGQEVVELAGDMVCVLGGGGFGDAANKVRGAVGGLPFPELLLAKRGVAEAEAGYGIGDGHATAATTGSARRAVGSFDFDVREHRGFFIH